MAALQDSSAKPRNLAAGMVFKAHQRGCSMGNC